jgi:RNA polymerase sigma-70 factor (ECF subfamily)
MFEGPRALTGQAIVSEAMALARAEEDPLEAVVRDHARLVYRVTYSVLRNHHDAEDATQETFVRVVRYRRKLAEVRDPRTWLARIAWRVAIGRRNRRPEVSLEENDQAMAQLRSSIVAGEEAVLSTEMSGFLGRLIEGLPAKLRHPLLLSTVEEMSPSDIAQVLEVSEAAVRSRLFRARQILREKLTALLEGNHGT